MRFKALATAAAALFAAATSAHAATFHYVGYSGGLNGESVFVETDSMKSDGNTRTVWVLNSFYRDGGNGEWHPANTAYVLARYVYDCTNRTMRALGETSYDVKGNRVLTEGEASDVTKVNPGTLAESELNYACDASTQLTDGEGFKAASAAEITSLATFARDYAAKQGWDKPQGK